VNQSDVPQPFAVIVYDRTWFHLDSEYRLEANEHTPMSEASLYRTLSPPEQKLLRRVPRTAG
jgi:acyl dehydratase